jgi:hypothetical protein
MRPYGVLLFLVFGVPFFCAERASGQILSQPTPVPVLTADSERWYLTGEPITYAGAFYFPAGAQVFFNANEMVRSGFYMGVPLYSRTTLEPYSVVFVPLARGRMQPYERRRTGDLAGTAGSTAPALTAGTPDFRFTDFSPESAGPPASLSGTTASVPHPAATKGTRTRIGPPSRGINAVFVDFNGRRWYRAGDAVPFDGTTMTEVGRRGTFPVYSDPAYPARIYIPVTAGSTVLTPYTLQRPQ